MSEGTERNLLQDENGLAIRIPLISDEPADETFEIELGMQTWADIVTGVATFGILSVASRG